MLIRQEGDIMGSNNGLRMDPVCGMIIVEEEAYSVLEHNGHHYPVCCPICQSAFKKHPEVFVILYESQEGRTIQMMK
jgi:YHS domain-containing protein